MLARAGQTVALPGNAAMGLTPRPSAPVATGVPQAALQMSSRRGKVLIYFLAAAFLLLLGAGLTMAGFSKSRPATLQIVGQYPFREGEIYIWVDGDLRYHDELHNSSNQRGKSSRTSSGHESLALTLPVTAGRHTIRVQVDAAGQIYDHDTAIPGLFQAYSQKTLMVNFASKNLELHWD